MRGQLQKVNKLESDFLEVSDYLFAADFNKLDKNLPNIICDFLDDHLSCG